MGNFYGQSAFMKIKHHSKPSKITIKVNWKIAWILCLWIPYFDSKNPALTGCKIWSSRQVNHVKQSRGATFLEVVKLRAYNSVGILFHLHHEYLT